MATESPRQGDWLLFQMPEFHQTWRGQTVPNGADIAQIRALTSALASRSRQAEEADMRRFVGLAVVLVVLGWGQAAQAGPITVDTLLSPTVIDFSQFTGAGELNGVTGPVQIGGLVGEDITVLGTNLHIWNSNWGLSGNGSWDLGRNGYLGLNRTASSFTVSFNSGPVSGVGGFLNYCIHAVCTSDLVISAYDSGGALLESFNVSTGAPIITPGGLNAGAFRGFSRPTADIALFTVAGDHPVMDDLSFSRGATVPVPEPSALILLATGLGALVYRRRLRH